MLVGRVFGLTTPYKQHEQRLSFNLLLHELFSVTLSEKKDNTDSLSGLDKLWSKCPLDTLLSVPEVFLRN